MRWDSEIGEISVRYLSMSKRHRTWVTAPGRSQVASIPHAFCIRPPSCPAESCWLQVDLIALSTLRRARSCTTQRAELGQPLAALTSGVMNTQQLCYPTGRCSSREEVIAAAMLPPAPSYTTQPAEPGRPRATSTPSAPSTRQLYCLAERCWLRQEPIAVSMLLRPQNCTTRRPGRGRLPAASAPAAPVIQRPCYPTGQP